MYSCLSDCTMQWVSFMSQWLYNTMSLLHVSVTVQCTTFLLPGCIHDESPSCLSDCTMQWVSFMSQWLYNTMSLLHVSVTVQYNESPSCLSDCTMHWVILHVSVDCTIQWVSFMSQWLHNALHFSCLVVFMVSLLHVSVTVQYNESPSCLSDCTMHYISCCSGCIHD